MIDFENTDESFDIHFKGTIQGPKGDKGEKGDKGDKGEKGDPGEIYDDTTLKEWLTSIEEGKVDKVSGKGLSTNDYTDEEADKVYEAWTISKQSNKAVSFESYISLINILNVTKQDEYNVGQSIYIQTLNVPDLWVYGVDTTSEAYTYTTDEAFIEELNTNGYVKVGYFKLASLETQKVDLTNYVEKVEGKGLSTNDYTDYDKRSVLELDNSYANVKRTVSSNNNTININDSSYSRIREIKSKNNQSLQLFRGSAFAIPTNQSTTLGNITITSDEQGIITINSNSNVQSYETLFFDINTFQFTSTEDYVELPEGDYVAFNNRTGYYPRPGVANAYTEIKVKNPNKSTLVYNIYDNYRTFHVDAGGKVCVRLVINASNIFENMFFKLKIEQGTIPTEWTPQLSPIIFDSNNYKEVYLARGFNMIKGTEPFSITYAADIDLAIQNNDFPILPEGTINDNDLIEFVNPIANKRYTIKKKDLKTSLNIPTKISELTNDNNFVTASEVSELISSLENVTIKVVEALPSSGESNIIYFVSKTHKTDDTYDEYLWINNAWEHIGSTYIDLSDYYTKSEINELINSSIIEYTDAQIQALWDEVMG